MKIAVIGGGIFGCTAAIHLARERHDVTLFEQRSGVLECATYGNQYRLHKGYHYPRSATTVAECLSGEISFREEYGEAIIDSDRHLYAIARPEHRSKTSAREYLEFIHREGLPEEVTSVGEFFHPDEVDLVVEVNEGRIKWENLYLAVDRMLRASGVKVKLLNPIDSVDNYDKVIIATYSNTNAVIANVVPRHVRGPLTRFQFEVCEKPVVRMPEHFDGVGGVVMDGDFGVCVDPLGDGLHLLGHVTHAVWHRTIGLQAEVPYFLFPYIDRGVVRSPEYTRFDKFIEDGKVFIPVLEQAEHVGSMFTVRTVLPGKDRTDERPTFVETIDGEGKYIRIFSGKIGTAVTAARQVVDICDENQA